MNVLGIITEYNPFHNGHLLHIERSKAITKSDYVIAVMSGNFVERGEPAILDKYSRTKMAILNGVDLVLELPVYSACASAEYFSKAAIEILDSTGVVDSVCFGSESGHIDELLKISNFLEVESAAYKAYLKSQLDAGSSYPQSRENAISHISGFDANVIKSPNNILGIEYLKALRAINSNIKPYTFKREKADYNSFELDSEISSALAIRKAIEKKDFESIKKAMPENAYHILIEEIKKGSAPVHFDNFSHILQYVLKTIDLDRLQHILDINEGLENRIMNCSSKHFLISHMSKEIKTKRYTYTKIQRALLHILLSISKEDFNQYDNAGVPYLRVLGFKKESSFLLKEIEKNSKLPLLTNIKKSDKILNRNALCVLQKEIETTDIYYLGSTLNAFEKAIEYKKQLVIV